MVKLGKNPIFHLTICNRRAKDASNKYSEFYFTRIKHETQDINDIVLKEYVSAEKTNSKNQLKDVNVVKNELLNCGYFEKFP